MGLDIYLKRFKKFELDESKVFHQAELFEKDLSYVTVADQERENTLPEDLLEDYTHEIKVMEEKFDFKKIFDTYFKKLPEYKDKTFKDSNLVIVGSAYESWLSRFVIKDFTTDVEVKIELTGNDKKSLTKEVPVDCYVYQTEEVDYQRKGLNDYGWELLPENCCYSTDKDRVMEMVESGGLDESFIHNWKEGSTAIIAWW
ncbi:hypothetical protein [Ligilactobacillus equi]|uniref:Uncharacterized protein n=2 Tax=Ligilactobacillus equi TaxID=137357 RepID=V7HZ59_9LACO|nr:hypothetical protein [Ligilactobacillus equi]ETA74483.1 hypothetical protein LEQ_0348 [Ligilactobacillus equi DPC 6820]KRL78107.1 hypothetical protein FC36_GL001157 [Ligilactobacillus equi DSM 15833 = JCM 10991]